MAENKTKKTGEDPLAFIAGIEDPTRRKDCMTIMNLLQDATGSKPEMLGPGIIGFGEYKYKSGKNVNDWFLTGFASRKTALTIYLMSGYAPYGDLMKKLGPHKTGVGCLYIKKLDDVDVNVLRDLVTRSIADFRKNYLSSK
jgi:hypothetical protein